MGAPIAGTITGVKYGKVTPLDGIECSAAAWAAWSALCTFCDWQCTKRGLPISSKAGTCYPSKKQLAARAHVSTRKIEYGIRELEALNLVRTEARTGDKNCYMLYPMQNAPTGGEQEYQDRLYGLTSIRSILTNLRGGIDDGDRAKSVQEA